MTIAMEKCGHLSWHSDDIVAYLSEELLLPNELILFGQETTSATATLLFT